MSKSAVISEDGLYRYQLTRAWGGHHRMLFVMLNPSTADANIDDRTILRCIGFAEREQFDSMEVVNLYAYRATDPKELKKVLDPEGPRNDYYIMDAVARAEMIVAAWGNNALPFYANSVRRKIEFLKPVHVFGLTQKRAPFHPLYLKANTPLVKWSDLREE